MKPQLHIAIVPRAALRRLVRNTTMSRVAVPRLACAWIASAVIAGALLLAAAPARAQGRAAERVAFAMGETDRHVEQAQRAAAGSADPHLQSELSAALASQAHAHAAFDAGRMRIALQLTLDARNHADQVVSQLKSLPEPNRAMTQVTRTRELLDRAQPRIDTCGDPRARELMTAALSMQQRAEAAIGEGRGLAAVELTMEARNHAFRAMRVCHIEDDLKGSVEVALKRTDDVLARARDAVASTGDPTARQALADATDLQNRAQAEYHAEHLEPSLKLTQAARATAHRAIQQVKPR